MASQQAPTRSIRFRRPSLRPQSSLTNNIAYISDTGNFRIRTLHLTAGTNNSNTPSSYTVASLAGSTQGDTDAVGTAAQFAYPYGIVYHKSSVSSGGGGVLYVADYGNARVRRIVVATANVTTVAALPAGTYCYYLCITNNGTT
jgi:hypothetical protein